MICLIHYRDVDLGNVSKSHINLDDWGTEMKCDGQNKVGKIVDNGNCY